MNRTLYISVVFLSNNHDTIAIARPPQNVDGSELKMVRRAI